MITNLQPLASNLPPRHRAATRRNNPGLDSGPVAGISKLMLKDAPERTGPGPYLSFPRSLRERAGVRGSATAQYFRNQQSSIYNPKSATPPAMKIDRKDGLAELDGRENVK